MTTFQSAGFIIESAIDLPGLLRIPSPEKSADLFIEKGTLPPIPYAKDFASKNWAFDGQGVWLNVADVGRFYVPKAGPIIVELLDSAKERDASIYLIGSILGIALHLRRKVAIHASAVLVNDEAVLFCGASGSGKSTIAAALEGNGYTVLCDDLCALEKTSKEIVTHSDGRLLKLWKTAVDGLGLERRRGGNVLKSMDKFYVSHKSRAPSSVKISRVYFLNDTPSHTSVRIEELNLPDAAAYFFSNAYRPGLINLLGQEALYLKITLELSSQAKMYQLFRPKDFADLPRVLEQLKAQWLS